MIVVSDAELKEFDCLINNLEWFEIGMILNVEFGKATEYRLNGCRSEKEW